MGRQLWAKAPSTVITGDALTPSARRVYLYLDLRAGKSGIAWLTLREIAEALAPLSERTARRAVRELERHDLISTRRRRHDVVYYVHERGEAAPSRMAQLPLGAAEISTRPDTSGRSDPPPDRTPVSGGADTSVRSETGDTSYGDQIPDLDPDQRARDPDPMLITVRERLRRTISRPNFDTWIEPTSFQRGSAGELVIVTDSEHVADYLAKRLRGVISTAAADAGVDSWRIACRVPR